MGNINIQSLFADIISTPEQREEKLLKEGMLQGQLIASGLKGRVANLAPLAQIAGQLGVQRQENLKRAVQPMLGIDPRTTGERIEEAVSGLDMSTPEGLREAALAIQSVDPLRAATLRQAAVEMSQSNEDRKRTVALQQLQLDEAEKAAGARKREAKALENILPRSILNMYESGNITGNELLRFQEARISALATDPPKLNVLTAEEKNIGKSYIDDNEAAQNLLSIVSKDANAFSRFTGIGGKKQFTQEDLLYEASIIRSLSEDTIDVKTSIDRAVESLKAGGIRSQLPGSVSNIYNAQLYPESVGQVNASALSGQSTQPEFNASQLSTIDSLVEEAGQLQAQTENSQANIPAEVSQSNETVMQQLLRGVLPQYGAVRNTIEGLDSQVSSGLENEARQAQNYFNTLDEELGASPTSGGASASDYLEAIKTLNFPGIDFATEQVPAMTKNIAGIFKSLIDTLSSVENIKKVTNEGIDVTLYGTGKLIESLVNGQSVGEKEINQVKENIKKLKSSLGKISAPDRKIVNEQIKKLEEFVLTNAGNLAGAFLD